MLIKFRKSRIALAIAGCSVLFASSGQAQITDLGTLGGAESVAYGLSADGSVVVGEADNNAGSYSAFRWTSLGGMVDLGTLGGTYASARGVSADGTIVVGQAGNGVMSRPFRWTQAGGMEDLGSLGGVGGGAWAISADGQVIVGDSRPSGSGTVHAFRWTSAGMVDLGTLGGSASSANGVSADGSVVVGYSHITGDSAYHAFRWTNGGMVDLGTLGGTESFAQGISGDGAVVVGYSDTTGDATVRAFRWTSSGMTDLGSLGGVGYSSKAYGISSDGNVIVGSSEGRAFRWTLSAGIQSVEDWLRANGVAVANNTTISARATNSDGSVVVGYLDNSHSFIARVSSVGSGLVTLTDVQSSLAGTAAGGSMALTSAGLSINGAHSRPLMRRVAPGQKTFWVAGDWGRDDHGSRVGSLGLAEFGGGYNLGRVQFNVSLGQTWASQKLVQNGSAEVEGTYLQAEAIMPVAGGFWATLGAYHHQGTTELKRGYLNAGAQDYSTGRPDVSTTGLRARLDWDNALQFGGAQLSPYADLTYIQSRLDGYTETSGGFPAQFNGRKENATELRLGLSATKAVAEHISLVGQLEAAHRFEQRGAGTSGQIIGLFGFDLAGSDNKQDWLRAGLGIQGNLAGGSAHLMLNATTQGAVPNVWLAAGWQKAF